MIIKQAIGIYYFKILLYENILALLVICHIVLSLFRNLEIHTNNLYFVIYDTYLLLG